MTNLDPHLGDAVSTPDRVQGAFLGAAVGDALGWPNELNSKNMDAERSAPTRPVPEGFCRWRRREGGRWYSHDEVIAPGEYSDDTQLLLSTARCVLRGEAWWELLTRAELPLWTAYERGGGGATKRAAEAWLGGREAWGASRSDNRGRYLDAGGNGVAMRIMPHCARAVSASDFPDVARAIVANGAATHGHPRALLGALAYGFALWLAFRTKGTLGFGSLVKEVSGSAEVWSVLPDVASACPRWQSAVAGEGYLKLWSLVTGEMLDLLSVCDVALQQGVVADDRKLLADIGCYDGLSMGSGTVAAAAAIYLSSRHAARPLLALREAAYARGTDTDTIASMTGALLGALWGSEWLDGLGEGVQDYHYICSLSEALATGRSADGDQPAPRVTPGAISRLKSQLAPGRDEGEVDLPYGGQAEITGYQQLTGAQDGTSVRRWRITAFGGQSLYVKRFERGASRQAGLALVESGRIAEPQRLQDRERARPSGQGHARVMVRLQVRDVARLRRFYEELLGCDVEDVQNGCMVGGVLLLLGSQEVAPPRTDARPVVSVAVTSVEQVFERARHTWVALATPVAVSGGVSSFRCFDPEGNPLEVFQTHS